MTQPELSTDEIQALLDRAVHDSTRTFDPLKRADLLERVLSEFDDHAAASTSSTIDHGVVGEPDASPTRTTEMAPAIEIDVELAGHGSRGRRQRATWLAVAAGVLAVVGLAAMAGRPTTPDISATTSITTAPPPSTPEHPTIDLDAALPQTLDERVEFSPLGLSLRGDGLFSAAELDAGRLVLRSTADRSDVVIEVISLPPGIQPLEELVDDAREAGSLTIQSSLVRVGDDLRASYGVRVTQDAVERFGCVPTETCVELGPVGLNTARGSEVVEIVGPDGRRFWWVESASSTFDAGLLDATAVLSTLEFTEG